MSRDPLGSDPLGIDPVAQIQKIKNPRLQAAVAAWRSNVVVRGVTLANRIEPSAPIGEDGQVLTEERRRELAAARPKYDVEKARAGELDYVKADAPIETEKLGTSAQKIVEQQPEMMIILDGGKGPVDLKPGDRYRQQLGLPPLEEK